VFVQVAEPIGAGFVETLAQPGGNATGFMLFEYSIGAKWLQLLKEIAPGVKQVGFLQSLAIAAGPGQFGAMQALAPSLGVEVRPIKVQDAGEIERAMTALARPANGGLIVAAAAAQRAHRDVIIKLAAQHRLPAIYAGRDFVTGGGLMSFDPDRVDQFRRAAAYIDRILKGEKPANLPVQAPTKYELVINLRTAKALGLDDPPMLLARANEVIE
jgi:putative ABC transport system substrate-binding protein